MIEIVDSTTSFDSVYNSPYAPKDENIKQVDCLIIPYEHIREGIDYCYSEYTEEILDFIREDGGLSIDIAATDEAFQPIELHALLLDVGTFIIMDVNLPLLLNLTASFIYDKLQRLHVKDAEVHVEYVVQKTDGSSKKLKYSGPASEFDTIRKSIQKL